MGSLREIPTDRQLAVLEFVADYQRREECPPTMREIADHLSIRSTNGVNDHLEALERKGFLVRREQVARGIRMTEKAKTYLAELLHPSQENTNAR